MISYLLIIVYGRYYNWILVAIADFCVAKMFRTVGLGTYVPYLYNIFFEFVSCLPVFKGRESIQSRYRNCKLYSKNLQVFLSRNRGNTEYRYLSILRSKEQFSFVSLLSFWKHCFFYPHVFLADLGICIFHNADPDPGFAPGFRILILKNNIIFTILCSKYFWIDWY